MIIKNATLVLANKIIKFGWIKIKNDLIERIGEGKISNWEDDEVIDASNKIIVPGFIDCHTHGGYGIDFSNISTKDLKKLSWQLTREGVTSYLPTFASYPKKTLELGVEVIGKYVSNDVGKEEILGIHLEGPFIGPEYRGCHEEKWLLNKVNKPWLKNIIKKSKNNIKMLTFAPEIDDSKNVFSFLKFLNQQKIIPSFGHTGINYLPADKLIKSGMIHTAHIFNQMKPIHHRNSSALIKILLDNKVLVEVIADGIHLSPEIIQLIYRLKGWKKITLITDSMTAKGLKDGIYSFAGKKVEKHKNAVKTFESGKLAGSVVNFDECFRNIIKFTKCSLVQAIHMSSINIAKQLGIFSKVGEIAEKKYADLVLLNNVLNIETVIKRGKIVRKLHSHL